MAEPISLDEAKKQLRVDGDDEDELIQGYIVTAREWVEHETGMVLIARVVTESFRTFGASMILRAWPVDITAPIVVAYHDRAGVPQTITNAVIRGETRPAELVPAVGERWPSPSIIGGKVTVTFTAGFVAAGQVPQLLKQAMQGLIVSLYDDRGGAGFKAAEASARLLCNSFRRRVL